MRLDHLLLESAFKARYVLGVRCPHLSVVGWNKGLNAGSVGSVAQSVRAPS